MGLPILLTEEDFRQSVGEATILSLANDDKIGEQEFAENLAKIVEVRNNELLDAEWLRRKSLRTGALPQTSTPFADSELIARVNAGLVSQHAIAVADRIMRNRKIVLFVAGAVVAAAGFLASGGSAAALVPALLPVARMVIAEMNAKDDDPLELPEVTFPQVADQSTRPTGINAAVSRGALPPASGADAAHGDPHDLPAGHRDTTGHHEPPDTHHTHH